MPADKTCRIPLDRFHPLIETGDPRLNRHFLTQLAKRRGCKRFTYLDKTARQRKGAEMGWLATPRQQNTSSTENSDAHGKMRVRGIKPRGRFRICRRLRSGRGQAHG